MADKAPLASVPLFQIPEVGMIKNPTGIGSIPEVTAAQEKYTQSIKDMADKLEARYAKPNYFKIASGFLKPQLGGFSASLGSASEAMAEQEELQRAIAPTVAQMRSQIALNEYGLAQGTAASKIAERAAKEGRIPNPTEAAAIAGLTQGPGAVPAAGQASSTAQFNQLIQALQSGATQTDLYAKFPKTFVDTYLPMILNMYPHLKPPAGTPSSLLGGTLQGGAPSTQGPAVAGVPTELMKDLPLAQQLEAQTQNVQAMQSERDKLQTTLSTQASTATPIFEAATNLYKVASNPDLAAAFGVFEKGDPMGGLGKALESQSVSNVLANMRDQIIAARLGRDREKRALSDLQSMQGALAELKVQMNNGVLNPTDFRTVAEGESIPGIRNTQDAFLRGVARIGSTALTRYETKAAFDRALEDKDFNVRNWTSSPYFREVQENAKKRTQSVIANRASQELPLFMRSGLDASIKPSQGKQEKPSGTPSSRPNERVIGGKTYVRQPDGSYKEKE